ncbi:hypothetical protein QPK31_25945 [Massilia sp. YIM B02769]|uniref:phage head spike fiber domain-containing protein n=1 Tax=Massilia sp. YIM B02769 TaxID=3050129 RepID=UPI0025B70C2F|nr:hypothetical protein [Massilia sp. YIM B02769]MDN4061666.1 hypothetical protein [Massilia sp. YIM B02769]
MPNLRIVSDNAIARAASLVASSTAGALAVSNLASDKKSSVHRAAGKSVTYTATWAEAEQVGGVALPFCNLSPAAQWRVRAASELGTTNLLKYTETFNTAYPTWCRSGFGTSNVTANYAMAPNGTMTADRIFWTSGGGSLQYLDQFLTALAESSGFSGSIFGQSGEMAKLVLVLVDKAAGQTVLEVNLDDGRTTYTALAPNQSGVTVDVIAVPSPAPAGWWRLKINGWNSLSGAATPKFQIYPVKHNSPSRGIALWPRSEWAANEDTALARIYPTWPIDVVSETAGTGTYPRYFNTGLRGVAGRTIIIEQTMKQISGPARYMGIVIIGAGGSDQGVMVNLATGAISFKTNGAQVQNATVEDMGNGYYRLRLEVTPSITGNFTWQIRANAAGNTLAAAYQAASGSTASLHLTKPYAYLQVADNSTGLMVSTASFDSALTDVTKGLNVWGAMLEPGPQVTSYYPSVAATPGVRPDGYMDNWQGAGYDSGWVLACPAPAVKLRGFTAAQASSAYAYGGGACARHWLPAAVMARTLSVEIDDPANLQGYVEAACLVIGTVWSPQYNASGASVSVVDRTEISRSAAGDQLADPGTISRKVPVDLRKMSPADRAKFLALVRNSRAYPVLLSVFPEHSDLSLERDHMLYGRRTKDSDVAYQFSAVYSTTIDIEEI